MLVIPSRSRAQVGVGVAELARAIGSKVAVHDDIGRGANISTAEMLGFRERAGVAVLVEVRDPLR
jgi:hypothetical protein